MREESKLPVDKHDENVTGLQLIILVQQTQPQTDMQQNALIFRGR